MKQSEEGQCGEKHCGDCDVEAFAGHDPRNVYWIGEEDNIRMSAMAIRLVFGEPRNKASVVLIAPYREAFKVPGSIKELKKHLKSKWDVADVRILYKNPCYPFHPVEIFISIHFGGSTVTKVILGAAAAETFRWLRERFTVKKSRPAKKQRGRQRSRSRNQAKQRGKPHGIR